LFDPSWPVSASQPVSCVIIPISLNPDTDFSVIDIGISVGYR